MLILSVMGAKRTKLSQVALAVVLLGLFFGSRGASGDDDCGAPVRLDDLGGSMENVPPLDQESLPICYAYSAAEILQTWRCSHGASDCKTAFVSPVAISVNAELWEVNHHTVKVTGPSAQKSPFWGYNRESIEAATLFRGPYCSQTTILDGAKTSLLKKDIDILFDQYKKNCIQAVSLGTAPVSPNLSSCRFMDGQAFSHQAFESFAQAAQECLFNDGLGDRTGRPIDLKLIESAFVESNPLLIIQGQIGETCNANQLSIPPMPPLDFYDIRPKVGVEPELERITAAKKAINSEFDKTGKSGQPIFVTYCADVLSAGKNFSPSYGKDCSGAHASLIIGRRRSPEKPYACQYLVRNSWGDHCSRELNNIYHYSSDWECDTSKGNYWIDQDVMMKATLEVGGVENEGIGGLMPKSYLNSRTQ